MGIDDKVMSGSAGSLSEFVSQSERLLHLLVDEAVQQLRLYCIPVYLRVEGRPFEIMGINVPGTDGGIYIPVDQDGNITDLSSLMPYATKKTQEEYTSIRKKYLGQ